jgi:hypothetical protein
MSVVQKQNPAESGEMAQRFMQFVMMQRQQVLFVLGLLDEGGQKMPPNLEAAKMFIDQLEMIQAKTAGNLIETEIKILENVLTSLRLAFVEVSGGVSPGMIPSRPMPGLEELAQEEAGLAAPTPTEAPAAKAAPEPSSAAPEEPTENKKKFTKTYG